MKPELGFAKPEQWRRNGESVRRSSPLFLQGQAPEEPLKSSEIKTTGGRGGAGLYLRSGWIPVPTPVLHEQGPRPPLLPHKIRSSFYGKMKPKTRGPPDSEIPGNGEERSEEP